MPEGPQPEGLFEALFHQALRIRRVEERIVELYPSDRIQSPVHLSLGQEMVAAAVCRSLRRTDLLFGSYRSHALYLAKGGDLPAMMAELYGRVDGVSGGKAGSMHLAAPEVGLMGSSAIVASTISHAVGAALAARLLGRDQVAVAFFGDGATEEGVYHEALNFASLRRLPVLFVCENNSLAVHSGLSARHAYAVTEHARAYRIEASRCPDGHDMLAVHEETARLVDALRGGGPPRLLEIETCRYAEHVGPGEDLDAGYRSREEVEKWRSRDPLLTRPELLRRFDPGIREEIDAAVAFAEASPPPGDAHLLTDVL